MDDTKGISVVTPVSLDTPLEELEQKILAETDVDKLKDAVDLFNLNIQKKNIVRTSKLSELQDMIVHQMEQRLDKKADEFSNQDLLTYFKTVQDTISKADNSLDSVNTTAIKVIQNQLNINVKEDELSRESKEKVLAAVRAIMDKATQSSSQIFDVEYGEE